MHDLGLTGEMVLSQEEIGKRTWATGMQAGFHRESYRRLFGLGLQVKVTVALAQLSFPASFISRPISHVAQFQHEICKGHNIIQRP
jgi:hypothetical protein